VIPIDASLLTCSMHSVGVPAIESRWTRWSENDCGRDPVFERRADVEVVHEPLHNRTFVVGGFRKTRDSAINVFYDAANGPPGWAGPAASAWSAEMTEAGRSFGNAASTRAPDR